jgi:hypothetical protein
MDGTSGRIKRDWSTGATGFKRRVQNLDAGGREGRYQAQALMRALGQWSVPGTVEPSTGGGG